MPLVQIFADALNNISHGKLTPEQVAMFESRCNIPEPEDAIHLIKTNEKIRIRNNTYLDGLKQMGAEEVFKTAMDRVTGNKSLELIRGIKEAAQLVDNNQTRGMQYKLRLLVGGSYMVTHNVDVAGKIQKIKFLISPYFVSHVKLTFSLFTFCS